MKQEQDEFDYHGTIKTAPYFEGWYFKVSTADFAFAIIIGIAKNKLEEHAFIQTIDTITRKTRYYRFAIEDVEIQTQPFFIRLKNNYFSKHHIIIDVEDLQADITMYACTDLQHTAYSPTIMGPFSYWKHMQCVHSIISLHHYVKGTIHVENEIKPINGIGYMEKDRGISFPREYVWAQSNSSNLKDCCFFFSIAHIPLGFTSFMGCICVLMIKQKQYRFASYYGVRIKDLTIQQYEDYKEVKLKLQQYPYVLHITIRQYQAYPLLAPKDGVMEPKVFESLDSDIHLVMYKRGTKVHDMHFNQAGSEIRMT